MPILGFKESPSLPYEGYELVFSDSSFTLTHCFFFNISITMSWLLPISIILYCGDYNAQNY